jgi:hypothetical protein
MCSHLSLAWCILQVQQWGQALLSSMLLSINGCNEKTTLMPCTANESRDKPDKIGVLYLVIYRSCHLSSHLSHIWVSGIHFIGPTKLRLYIQVCFSFYQWWIKFPVFISHLSLKTIVSTCKHVTPCQENCQR